MNGMMEYFLGFLTRHLEKLTIDIFAELQIQS